MEERQPAEEGSQSIAPGPGRIASVDALRGFDMFWIAGGAGFVTALAKLCGGKIEQWLVPQLEHAEWVGFHFYDLIFPLFAFIVGMSAVFSLEKLIATKGKKAAYRRLIRRTIILYLLGIIYYGGMSQGFHHIRLLGVLQRLAHLGTQPARRGRGHDDAGCRIHAARRAATDCHQVGNLQVGLGQALAAGVGQDAGHPGGTFFRVGGAYDRVVDATPAVHEAHLHVADPRVDGHYEWAVLRWHYPVSLRLRNRRPGCPG